jgi:hypothetical protein
MSVDSRHLVINVLLPLHQIVALQRVCDDVRQERIVEYLEVFKIAVAGRNRWFLRGRRGVLIGRQ